VSFPPNKRDDSELRLPRLSVDRADVDERIDVLFVTPEEVVARVKDGFLEHLEREGLDGKTAGCGILLDEVVNQSGPIRFDSLKIHRDLLDEWRFGRNQRSLGCGHLGRWSNRATGAKAQFLANAKHPTRTHSSHHPGSGIGPLSSSTSKQPLTQRPHRGCPAVHSQLATYRIDTR